MMNESVSRRIVKEDMERIYNCSKIWETLRGKKVYITGAAGMIASYIVFFLIYLNESAGLSIDIYACARNSEKLRKRFGQYVTRPYFHCILADAIGEVPFDRGFDYIIHAASLASPQYYGCVPVDVMLPNVVGTWRLLEHMVKYGCEGMVFFSSGSVYGDLECPELVREDMCGKFSFLAEGNCYGESKRAGEALCTAYFRQYGVKVRTVRLFHTYGPTMDIRNDARSFASFMKCLVDGKDIVMRSDGSASRSFLYVSDAVAGVLLAMIKGEAGDCYNLGNPHTFMTIAHLAELIAGLTAEKLSVRIEKREKRYTLSPESRKPAMDISRLCTLGWKPLIGAEEGFGRCYLYLMDSKDTEESR